MGLDVSGIGALKTQLQQTNEQLAEVTQLLGQVLAELKHMNVDRLSAIHAALERVSGPDTPGAGSHRAPGDAGTTPPGH